MKTKEARIDDGKAKKNRKSPPKWRPIDLPEEDFWMLDRGDFTEFEYLNAKRFRAKRGRTKQEREFLAKHDAVEARIQSDPKAVLLQAREALDEGTVLLLKLIRSKKLFRDFGGHCHDEALGCYTSRLTFLHRQLVRMAEDRNWKMCQHLWYEAMYLADAVVRLAVAFPEEFRSVAETSLTMPSLRSRSPEFSCDAAAIAKAIHLAERHAAPNISDNRSRFGALCHFVVAQQVEKVEWARRQREHFERDAKFSEARHAEDIIPAYTHPDWRRLYEESWRLPELRGHAEEWWKGRIREMVRHEFKSMRRHPTHNPALWQELERATDRGTEKAKWHELEKNCVNKLKKIAGDPAAGA